MLAMQLVWDAVRVETYPDSVSLLFPCTPSQPTYRSRSGRRDTGSSTQPGSSPFAFQIHHTILRLQLPSY